MIKLIYSKILIGLEFRIEVNSTMKDKVLMKLDVDMFAIEDKLHMMFQIEVSLP